MLIAHITDLHIKLPGKLAYGIVDSADFLKRCVNALQSLDPQPDLIVVTGDLVDTGDAAEYAHLQQLLAPLQIPLLVVPGNHDERESMRFSFPLQDWVASSDFLQFSGIFGPLRIVGLDTVVPGEGRGELCAARLGWLTETLSADRETPTLILMHHPPFLTGIGHMDKIGLKGRETFAEILSLHAQVKLILCGHLHRPISSVVGGCLALTCPSPAHQVAFDLRPDGPSCFRMEPPGFMLHRWSQDGFVSHSVFIGDYAGPYPFFDADGRLLDD